MAADVCVHEESRHSLGLLHPLPGSPMPLTMGSPHSDAPEGALPTTVPKSAPSSSQSPLLRKTAESQQEEGHVAFTGRS